MHICKFCNKEYKTSNAGNNHQTRCKLNPERITFSEDALRKLASASHLRGQTEETKQKLSKIAKDRGLGGHTSKVKLYFKKKDGTVVYLQSSYELKFAYLLEEMNIKWSRPDPLPWVDRNGEYHRYYPDFKIGSIYIDTKNDYLAVADLPKINTVRLQNNVDLRIVTKDMINEEFVNALKT